MAFCWQSRIGVVCEDLLYIDYMHYVFMQSHKPPFQTNKGGKILKSSQCSTIKEQTGYTQPSNSFNSLMTQREIFGIIAFSNNEGSGKYV